MFITFEGIDGCGKTTQIHKLQKYLLNHNKKVNLIREPGGTDFSESIREILLNSKHSINSISELMLFEAARADLTEKVIMPAIAKGEFVLSDRFYDSTTAYQGYGRELDLKKINFLNEIGALNIQPNITFYLHISLEISYKRSEKRKPDRIEKAGDDFFKRVINGFEEITINNPDRVYKIDASHGIEETFEEILKILKFRKII